MFIHLLFRDLKTALSDRQAILTLIVMPIILITILSFALSGMFEEAVPISTIRLGVVFDYEAQSASHYLANTAASLVLTEEDMLAFDGLEAVDFKRIFLDDFLNSDALVDLVDANVYSKELALEKVSTGELDSAIIFDNAFYKAYILNFATPFKNRAQIELVSNNNNFIKKQVVEGLVDGFSSRVEEMWMVKNLLLDQLLSAGMKLDSEQVSQVFENVFQVEEETSPLVFNKEILKGRRTVTAPAYYTMAMLSMFLLFTAGYGSRLMLEEKESFTLQRLHMSGVSRWMILMSKFVLMYSLGLIQLIAMVVFSSLVLGVVWGSLSAVLLTASASIFAISGLGLMIAVYTVNQGNFKVANMLETFIFQVMAFLGGSFIPLSVLPDIFKQLSKLTVNGLTMNALLQNMQGFSLSNYRGDLYLLLLMGSVFMGIAILSYGKRGKNNESTSLAST